MKAFMFGLLAGAGGVWAVERAVSRRLSRSGTAAVGGPTAADPTSAAAVRSTMGLLDEGLAHVDAERAMQLEFEPIGFGGA